MLILIRAFCFVCAMRKATSSGRKKKDDDDEDDDNTKRWSIALAVGAMIVFFSIVTIALSIAALVESKSAKSDGEKDDKFIFKTKFDQTTVDPSSPNISITLSKKGNWVNIYVPFWTGFCASFGSPAYAPSMFTVDDVPTTYRVRNKTSSTYIRSPYSSFSAESNHTTSTGSFYVDQDGSMWFYVNWGNSTVSWSGDCTIYSATITYQRDV